MRAHLASSSISRLLSCTVTSFSLGLSSSESSWSLENDVKDSCWPSLSSSRVPSGHFLSSAVVKGVSVKSTEVSLQS